MAISLKSIYAIAGSARCIFFGQSLSKSFDPPLLGLRTISSYTNKLGWNGNTGVLLCSNSRLLCRFPSSDNSSIYNYRYPIYPDFITLSIVSQHFSTDQTEPSKKLTLIQRFKQMYRDYWYVLVPVHAVTSLAWFGGFYYLLQSGVDVVAILESYNVSERLLNPLRDSKAGYLAISYALYKIFTPIRYTVTLGGTTISINYLQKWGYIKPIPTRDKLKEMYQERKDTLIERRDNIIESVLETKAELKERKDNIIESVRETAGELKKKTDDLADRAANASAITESEKRNAKQRRDALVGEKDSIVGGKGDPR